MARKLDKQKALLMRKKGMSYSQIKEKLNVSKSTLSVWLANIPLSESRIRALRANSPIRIERFRNTMKAKREKKFSQAYNEMSLKIKKLSSREIFLAGMFLYWAEGTKTTPTAIALTNTNPNMLKFYIRWLKLLGVNKNKLKVSLHIYKDMDVKKQELYWSNQLKIKKSQFRKSYIKDTKLSSIKYHGGFGQGTCSVVVDNTILRNKVLMGLKYIQENLV